eukprot:TRINITY_DN120219_c4_g1_i1.p1 TRINITY_DN120219_c4_g1~~TRINITY_DN120219_c4_g1_i1.p1  ORF type:complete len:1747 (-),score=99.47 TRINITY_DN120219_c4_g1_i1:2673-7913(-)
MVRGGPFRGKEYEFKRPKCKFGSSSRVVNATYVRCTPQPYPPGTKEPEIEEKVAFAFAYHKQTDVCLQCDNSPPGAVAEIVPFTISLTGDFTDSANSIRYRYYPDPKITAIFPKYGRKNGGTLIEIWGENFLNFDQYLRCAFGPRETPAYFVDEHYIYCYSPPSDTVDAPMPLSITMNDQQFSQSIDYWYYEFPSIYMLDPNRGPDTGGTHVLLKGNNFDPFVDLPINNYNDTMCMFGPLGIVPAKVINSTKVVCVSPPSYVLREVEVEITLNTRDWTKDGVIFYYYHPPFLYDIEPLMGPVVGGTVVHIHGSNFEDTGAIRCKFGDYTVPGQFVNINELRCVSPRTDRPGYVPFQVAVHEDDFSSPDLFKYLYYDTPMVRYIEPTCGPERGYTQIIVYGENFIDPGPNMVYCVFNETIYMNATVYEPNRIKCSSPPVLNAYGVNERKISFYDLKVTLNRKDTSGPAKRFSYYREATIKSVTPSSGPTAGGTIVKISGKGFKPACACNVTVRFGTFQVRPINYTESTIYVRTPNVSLPDDVVVSYGINGQQYVPDPKLNYKDVENTFTYYDMPLVTSYSPRWGPSVGGTMIHFTGLGFTPFADSEGKLVKRPVWVRMRHYGAKGMTAPKVAEYVDNENVYWTTPPGDPHSKHVLEMSLNNIDYTPIVPVNESYSYTYYSSPRIDKLYPSYGPVVTQSPIPLFIKGRNFECPNNDCRRVTCRFGKGDEAIYVPAIRVSQTEIHCNVPKYNRPDVVPVEVSLDGEYYTNDNREFGFYEAYVWNVKPKMVSRVGNTTIRIHGYGFVNTTGTYLKVRYGYPHKKLRCKGGPCIMMGRYIDKNTIEAETYPYNEITYESTGLPLNRDEFPVEVSVYGDAFTRNNATIFYFTEPAYTDPSPSQVPANGNETIYVPTNFRTKSTDPKNPLNDEKIFKKYGNATCRYRSVSGKTVYTQGNMVHYPMQEAETLNSIICPSPEWELSEGTDSEDVVLDISVNGADYSGRKVVKVTERLAIYRIYPTCGPVNGRTKMHIFGTGLKQFNDLHLKWGVLTSIFLEKDSAQAFIYNKEKPVSTDPYENEIVSLNEDVKLQYKNMKQYQSIYSYSPKLPNADRTHGGPVYLSVGRTTQVPMDKKKAYALHYYGPSTLEYYYYQQPVAKDMKPRGGPTTGGTMLIIRGAWFKYMPEYGVKPYAKVGDKVVRCDFESTVRIICRTPPNSNTDARHPVSVGLNGVDFVDTGLFYHYYYPPVIEDISPKSGPESGGTRIHLRGVRFSNLSSAADFKCRFVSLDRKMPPKYIPAIFENSTSIICPTPGGWSSGSRVNVEVTFNGEDYTDSGSIFYFYSILSAHPRSGPSDGTTGILTIEGSGFKESNLIYCYFDKVGYKPIEVKWNYIKCRIPKSKHGEDFFGTVPLEVTINGVDSHPFIGGFHYYPQINVTDFFPKTGPAKGNGIIKIYGNKFRADFALARPACRFGKYIGDAEVLNEHEMLCHIPKIEAINQTYKAEAALNGQAFVKANTKEEFVPYGIYDIDPYSGPIGTQTQITVTGEGFTRDGKAKCRFGVPGNYAILEGKVLSNQQMICSVPKKFEAIAKVMALPFAVPFSISFLDEKFNPMTGGKPTRKGKASNVTDFKFDPWTDTGHVYRFYKQPTIVRITPKSCKVRDIVDVYAFTDPKTPFIERTFQVITQNSNILYKQKNSRSRRQMQLWEVWSHSCNLCQFYYGSLRHSQHQGRCNISSHQNNSLTKYGRPMCM